MKWNDKEIKELTQSELIDASFSLNKMLQTNEVKKQYPKYKLKFAGQKPPEINPAFAALKSAVDKEIKDRANV